MVHTTEIDVTFSTADCVDRCLDGININNSCRQVYLRRMESVEECKRSTKAADTNEPISTIEAALMKLRNEMVILMDLDTGLMRQMLILNEKVEELKTSNICQMSKESLDSQESLYQQEAYTSKHLLESQDSLYHSDEQMEEFLFDSKESVWNQRKQAEKNFCDSVDSLYQTDEEDNIDIGNPESTIDSLCLDSKTSLTCPRNVESNILLYDSMFEKLLDFDDK